MDDAEHEQDAVFADRVVHDPILTHAEPVEGVGLSTDRLHLLAADAAATRCGSGKLIEAGTDPLALRGR